MNDLILIDKRIIKGAEVQTVSARDLYLGLGLDRSQWSRWSAQNIEQNEFFLCDQDWQGFDIVSSGNKTADYAITVEFAKHLAMMAKTEKAHAYRNYFLECENRAKSAMPSHQLPQTFAEALRLAAEQAEQIERQKAQIEQQKPAVAFLENYVEAKSTKSLREVAKVLGVKEREFIAMLERDGILFRQSGSLLPLAHYHHKGLFEVKTGEANGHAYHQTRFTPEGIAWIAKRIGEQA